MYTPAALASSAFTMLLPTCKLSCNSLGWKGWYGSLEILGWEEAPAPTMILRDFVAPDPMIACGGSPPLNVTLKFG